MLEWDYDRALTRGGSRPSGRERIETANPMPGYVLQPSRGSRPSGRERIETSNWRKCYLSPSRVAPALRGGRGLKRLAAHLSILRIVMWLPPFGAGED